jgi:glycosyltransferase involved in cell wall biosynthesis
MVHEVRYHTRLIDKPTRWVLAGVQWLLVRDILAASTHVYVSTPSWEPSLRRHGAAGRRARVTWLPVPSNIPVVADPPGVEALRRRFAPGGETVVGTFGTFSGAVAALLARSLPCLLLGRPDRRALLLGRGGERFAARLAASHPSLAGRLDAPGALAADDVSRHLQACNLLLQPYPDGVTSRRTSTMAALAHGLAVVTNAGHLAEPFWAGSGAVALAPSPDPAALVRAAEALIADPGARGRVAAEALRLYECSFAIERTMETLLGPVRERAGHLA